MGLVADVDRDQQRGELLDDPRHLQRAGVDRAQAGDQLDQAGDPGLVGLAVAADQHVLVELGVGVGEAGRPDRVQRGDDGDALGHHLLRLLCGRALPDAERAGRLAADRGRQRHRAVDQDLTGAQRVAQVVEVLRLGAEGDGEEDDLAAPRCLLVERPSTSAPGTASRSFAAASSARSAEREPITTGLPASAQRSARPAPRAPVPPTIGIGSLHHARASLCSPR